MRRVGALIAAMALAAAFAAPASAAAPLLAPPTAWDGTNPFSCQLQQAGFAPVGENPRADPYCVQFDKTRQNVTELGIVDFLLKEPARVLAAVDNCFYFQADHWRASVIQDDRRTDVYEWEGRYFFDMARGDGGVYISNLRIGGHRIGSFGYRSHNNIPVNPLCVARARAGGVYG